MDIRERPKAGPIILTDLDAAPEPRNLRRLKAAIRDRWGTVPLLDMLTETALRTGCLDAFTPVGTRGDIAAATLFERLLLAVYAYGTNTGIRAVAAGEHGHAEDELRYVRRRYITVESCRQAARVIANATFAARQAWLWGEGSTAVASDSTHFRAWDQNIFTEWHSRYRNGKRGVLIYWTVDKGGAMAVHSQLLECSASEVHAMVEGAMRHGTDMNIEASYVDSHGQSFVGFGVTRLLGFDLLPRIKQVNHCKLYLPAAGDLERYPRLRPALTNPIKWDLIEQQYDLMMKYATAIRLGTASTEAILRRFSSDVTHPGYAAMLEVGRAQRTIFIPGTCATGTCTFAEFEVDLLKLRTREGMAIAKERGRLKGKQPKLTTRQQAELVRLHSSGEYTIAELMEVFSVGRATVYRVLHRAKQKTAQAQEGT